MDALTDKTVEIVKQFLIIVRSANIRIEKAILFGSYIRGTAGKWSDIDLAVISPDFSGIPFYDSKKLTPFLLKIDTRIELHPFRPEDFTEENDLVKEIIKNGLELKV